jgi:hypothetical protein
MKKTTREWVKKAELIYPFISHPITNGKQFSHEFLITHMV